MTSRRPRRPLSPEEEALWRAATKSDKPLDKRDILNEQPEPKRPRRPINPRVEEPPPAPRGAGGNSLDGNLAQRLKRGQLPIEGRIDLHGMTLVAAEERLASYIAGAASQGKRMLLVITGKGAPAPLPHERDYMPERPRPGAIRAALPNWLKEGPSAPYVLSWHPAQPKDGGAGAYYVLLRRRRDR